MSTLSARQDRILRFLHSYVDANGYPPSVREVAAGTGLRSISSVGYHLRVLEEYGYIRRTPNINRGLTILAPYGWP